MEARISFIEPAIESPAPTAAVAMIPDLIEASYVQELIRSGIVTHRFKPTEEFDAMFAASEIHELPGVRFVAAFKQGVILLGCPEGPPESIADLVEPAKLLDSKGAPDFSGKLDALLAGMEALQKQSDRRHDASAISKNIASRAAELQEEKLQSVLLELGAEAGAVTKTLEEISAATSGANSHTIEALTESLTLSREANTSVSNLVTEVARMQTQAAQRETDFAAFSKSLDALHSMLGEPPQGDDTNQLGDLLRETAQIKSVLTAVIPDIGAGKETLKGMESKIAALADSTDANVKTTDSRLALIDTVLQKLDTLLDQTHDSEDQDTLADRFSAELEQGLLGVRQDIKRLKNQPAPAFDLTEQRRSFATFTTVMGANAKRLEAAVEQIGVHLTSHDQSSVPADVLRYVEALPEQMRNAIPTTEISLIASRLDELLQKTRDADAQFSGLKAHVDAVVATAKLEIEALKELYSSSANKLEQKLSFHSDLDQLEEKLGDMTLQLGSMPDAISAACSTAIERIKCPPGQPDLTAQRQSFARFGTAMANVVARLEAAIAQLGKPRTTADTDEMQLVLQALPVTLYQAMTATRHPDAHDLSELNDNIAQVLARIADLDVVRDMIENLVRRPEPVPDFSEHRRGFARFFTAMTTIVNRLEHVADDLSNAESDKVGSSAIVQGLQDIDAQLRSFIAIQAEQTSARPAQLMDFSNQTGEHFKALIDPLSNTIANESNSLEDIRFIFAEQVALQIRNKTESD